MNPYEQKQERKRGRFLELAEQASTESQQRRGQADNMAHVMNGTPVLVGHHSEQRHRRDIEKMHNNLTKSFELQKKANHYTNKASAVGTAGISSDDPDAIPKLRERIATLEQKQDLMKKTNAALRKNNDQALLDLGYSDAQIVELKTPDFCGRIGFPNYALSNNNGNLRRLKQRLAHLETTQDDSTQEIDAGAGIRIVDNVEDNRLQIIFPEKPDADTRSRLKQWGFRWSPTNGAWQRHRSPSALTLAKLALKQE